MSVSTNLIWDQKITVKSINLLHEVIKDKAINLILTAQRNGIYLRIPTNGGFISYQDQQNSFDKKLSNVQAGDTYHNFGLAFDVLPLSETSFTLDPRPLDGKRTLTNDKWEMVGQIGRSLGFEWGGEWVYDQKPHPKFDSAHFQIPRDIISLNELKEMREIQKIDLLIFPDSIKNEFNFDF